MRSISATLLAAQHSGTLHDPYIRIYINSTDYTSRLLELTHVEEPYREWANIVLANSDRHFNNVNLTGKSFSIGYGYVTGSGNEYCGDGTNDGTPTLWVKNQSLFSAEGDLFCVLECEGGWMRLQEYTLITTADPPYLNIPFTANQNIEELIREAMVECGFTLNTYSGASDGIIDSYQPIFSANPFEYESAREVIKRLIDMTKCYIRQVEGEAFELVYPQDGDAADITYSDSSSPQFKEYVARMNLLVPNKIVVFANMDADTGEWDTPAYPLIIGEAQDDDSIAVYGEVIEYVLAPYIGNQPDATNRASSILAKYEANIVSSKVVLPFHDCQVELYDKIAVNDNRGV